MIGKLFFVTVLTVGVFAELKLTEDHQKVLTEVVSRVCKSSNAPEKAQEVENAIKTFGQCILEIIDIDTIKKEIEEAKPHGALDEVFKKYCAKTPQLKACIHTVIAGVTPCLPSDVRELTPIANNATDSLLEFACHMDGDRIALFIAEKGPECLQEKVNDIRECANELKIKSLGALVELSNAELELCAKYDKLSECVVSSIEACDNTTPANMAEALFKYVRIVSPCKDIPKKH